MNVGAILCLAGADDGRCRGRHLAASDVPAATGHIPPASTLLAECVSSARVFVFYMCLCHVLCAEVAAFLLQLRTLAQVEQIRGLQGLTDFPDTSQTGVVLS